jgi:ketosteroid isomerase-like protein
MKCREIFCCLLVLVGSLFLRTDLHAADKDDATKAVAQLDNERADAQMHLDFATLDRILADDLTYIHASGLVQSKAEFIADLKSNKRLYKSIKNSDVNVRVVEGAAVVTARSDLQIVHDGKENDLSVRVTEVYAKRNGGWQLIAYQSTRVTP